MLLLLCTSFDSSLVMYFYISVFLHIFSVYEIPYGGCYLQDPAPCLSCIFVFLYFCISWYIIICVSKICRWWLPCTRSGSPPAQTLKPSTWKQFVALIRRKNNIDQLISRFRWAEVEQWLAQHVELQEIALCSISQKRAGFSVFSKITVYRDQKSFLILQRCVSSQSPTNHPIWAALRCK